VITHDELKKVCRELGLNKGSTGIAVAELVAMALDQNPDDPVSWLQFQEPALKSASVGEPVQSSPSPAVIPIQEISVAANVASPANRKDGANTPRYCPAVRLSPQAGIGLLWLHEGLVRSQARMGNDKPVSNTNRAQGVAWLLERIGAQVCENGGM